VAQMTAELEGASGRTIGGLIEREHTASLWDGTELFYRSWQPRQTPAARAIILFHRGHEHSGRYAEFIHALDLPDTAVFAWDARGHGRSPGERGHAPSFMSIVKDADRFTRVVAQRHDVPVENMVVLGHSVGAVVAAAWVHDYAPPVRAMVLVSPALRVKLYVPLAIPGLRVMRELRLCSFVKSYVRSGLLTHDAEQAAAYDRDNLISRQIAVNVLLGLHDTSTRLLADAGAIRTPTQILAAGSDWVVRNSAQKQFFRQLGSPIKQMETYEGLRHAMLHETDRQRPIAAIRRFVIEVFDRSTAAPIVPSPSAAPASSTLARLAFGVSRLFLKTIGRLSEGVRIGWRSGFDSGSSLDHVYRNQATGTTPLGRLIDRIYLNSPGWRGIRQRKVHLEGLLDRAVRAVHAERSSVRILDIASGPGRYVLDLMKRLPELPIEAMLRDWDEQGLVQGRALATQMGLNGVAFERGDAFDEQSLTKVAPKANIAIVSGLYELFSDNDLVSRSLRGLHAVLEEGGWLIYTNQPWHPQLTFIAHVLVNREQQPWVMRCRAQAEIDDLVRAAGFDKCAMEIDEQGIFTVSLARKSGRRRQASGSNPVD
jgi:alpha-beta hydrolase superfamily lysophospholipase